MALIDELITTYPWIQELGLTDLVMGLITDDMPGSGILEAVYKSEPYQKMFPGMYDENGRRRFASEREYMDRVEDYRTVLREFNAYDPAEDLPMNFAGFMAQGIQPGELQKRFSMYREVERAGQDVKDAYYVYAGMDVTTDDLYRAMVNPSFADQLQGEYDRNVAQNTFDYETFITRATERGLQRVAEQLEIMQSRGLVTSGVVSNLLAVDPNFAREVMGALFTGGDFNANKPLALDELETTFEYAMIGSAAKEQGLEMPTRERVARLRAAGVDRAKALRSYGAFSEQRTALRAMADRAKGDSITQSLYEDAVFLGSGEAQRELDRATSGERSLGANRGGFQLGQSGRRITQSGR